MSVCLLAWVGLGLLATQGGLAQDSVSRLVQARPLALVASNEADSANGFWVFGQDQEVDVPSPSDRPLPGETQGEITETTSPSEVELDPPVAQDSLTPLQNRALSLAINPTNISLDGIGTGVLPGADLPQVDHSPLFLPDGVGRGATFKCVHWRPSQVCHFPLYFEDAMLERHGHVRFGHLQPWASGVKFFSTITLLPYLKTLQPGREGRYALGHYRPGTCAPKLKDHLPWDSRAAVVETLSMASFFWAAPL